MTEELLVVSLLAGSVMAIAAFGWLVILAFRTRILWGMACLICPPVAAIFLVLNLRKTKGPLALLGFSACVGLAALGLQIAKAPVRRITIGRETTVIVEPLTAAGYPDYLQALNDEYRLGVTPENNAAALMVQAFGPETIPTVCRERFFDLLGTDAVQEAEGCVTTRDSFRKQLREESQAGESADPGSVAAADFRSQVDEAMRRPWSPTEFPAVVRWLQANAHHFSTFLAASQRPRCYVPLVSPPEGEFPDMVVSACSPNGHYIRECASLLAARAMFQLHQGDIDASWDDTLTCHRLGRLFAEDPTLIGRLAAAYAEFTACQCEVAIARYGELKHEMAARMIDQLESLKPFPAMSQAIDVAERFAFLDAVSAIASGTSPFVRTGSSAVDEISLDTVDWNRVLRVGNSRYDRAVEAMRMPTHSERERALRRWESDTDECFRLATRPLSVLGELVRIRLPRQSLSVVVGDHLACSMIPAADAASREEDCLRTAIRFAQVSIALSAYHFDHAEYPDALSRLSPSYLRAVPKDVFTGNDFHYRLSDSGVLVCAMGPAPREPAEDLETHIRKYVPAGTNYTTDQHHGVCLFRLPNNTARNEKVAPQAE